MDFKTLHAKIGELTLENDFLEGALWATRCWRIFGYAALGKIRDECKQRCPLPQQRCNWLRACRKLSSGLKYFAVSAEPRFLVRSVGWWNVALWKTLF